MTQALWITTVARRDVLRAPPGEFDEEGIRKAFAVGLVSMICSGSFGCMYAGLAATPDGTVYIARNDLFLLGLLRKLYACKAAGSGLVCSETQAP